MTSFKWSKKKYRAAELLADGEKIGHVSEEVGIAPITLYRWRQVQEFTDYVDDLTLRTGIAVKAERLRIAKRMVKARTDLTEYPVTNADLLAILKYAQDEIEGQQLNVVGDPERPITYEVIYTDPGEDTDTFAEAASISANGNYRDD